MLEPAIYTGRPIDSRDISLNRGESFGDHEYGEPLLRIGLVFQCQSPTQGHPNKGPAGWEPGPLVPEGYELWSVFAIHY